MNGLWLQDGQFHFRTDLPVPEVKPGMALIKLRLAGICSTDLEMARGYYPFIGVTGHEFVGEVMEAPGNETWIGKRVVGEISIMCGECQTCKAGRPNHCENRTTLGILGHDGVFAEYFTLPIENLHIVPERMQDEVAVFTEPLAAALEIQKQVQITKSMRVLVVGAGRLGLLIAQTLHLTGCDLQIVVRREEPAQLLSNWGISAIYPDDVVENAYDLVVEVTGSPDGFELSRKAVRPMGTLVLKSTYARDVMVNLSAIVVDEVTLIGSRCGPFKQALQLLEAGHLETQSMISARYKLSEGFAGLKKAGEHGVLKVLLEPD